ncbi:SpoIIE family protein phosphatase [Streptomyces sp. NPDC006638]|uniref:SpoIIE family protein phosphatase n=1 Tax=Streptomyces sp. NPDC006638 TaxID=3157183 RepID=UPI0033A26AE2
MADLGGMAPGSGRGAGGPEVGPFVVVGVIRADGTVAGWTRAAEDMVGRPAGDVVGRPAGRLLMSAGDAPAAETWSARARDGEPWTGMIEVRHGEGHGVRMICHASPMSAENGGTDWFLSAAELSGTPSSPAAEAATQAALLARAPIGLSLWDLDLRCVWLNGTAERQDGAPRRQRMGRRVTETHPGSEAEAVEAAMVRVLDSGAPVVDHAYQWIAPGRPEQRAYSCSYFRLDGEDGRPLGVCAMSVDISGSGARERLAVLSEAGTRIGTTLDVINTAQELADVSVPLLADYVTVDLADSVPLGNEPLGRLAATAQSIPVFRRAGVASIHSALPESLWPVGEAVFVPPSSPFTNVLASRTSHFEPVLDTSPGTWLDHDPDRARAIAATGMHSLIIVPLQARGTVLGVAVFVRTENLAPFTRDDLLLAEDLGARASLSLDNARRYTRERTAALALQRSLLPHYLSGGSAVEIASRYLPTDMREGVGGDWFDVIPLPGARVALVVGDVVGHGLAAAATMGQLRTAVRTLADMDLPPDELLAHLDELVVHLTEGDAGNQNFTAPVMGGTCVYAVYDPVGRCCTVARAGHPPPAIVSPDGRVTFPDLPPGTPIGLGLAPFESVELALEPGSVIALYSDGLVESREADIDTGLERLGAALSRTGTSLEDLCAEVVATMTAHTPRAADAALDGAASGGPASGPASARALTTAPSEDDVALLLARTRALGPDQVASWDLRRDPTTVAEARSYAADRLASWGLEHLADTVQLIVSELVTNALRHGAGPVRLRLIRHSSLVCEVSDADNSTPRLRRPRALGEGGWGLLVVSSLADRWGSRLTPDGKIVWAELELPPGS